jgi:hypothetical protein
MIWPASDTACSAEAQGAEQPFAAGSASGESLSKRTGPAMPSSTDVGCRPFQGARPARTPTRQDNPAAVVASLPRVPAKLTLVADTLPRLANGPNRSAALYAMPSFDGLAAAEPPWVCHAVDRRPVTGHMQGIRLNRQGKTAMRRVEIVPDWVIAVLAVLVVAGAIRLFGSFGVLVLGMIAATIWIAQIGRMYRSSPARRIRNQEQ